MSNPPPGHRPSRKVREGQFTAVSSTTAESLIVRRAWRTIEYGPDSYVSAEATLSLHGIDPGVAVFGGYEAETKEDKKEALSQGGRKKQAPQVSLHGAHVRDRNVELTMSAAIWWRAMVVNAISLRNPPSSTISCIFRDIPASLANLGGERDHYRASRLQVLDIVRGVAA